MRLAEHDGDLLHWFYDEGYVPGSKVELREAQPAAGQLKVVLDEHERAIGEKAAQGLTSGLPPEPAYTRLTLCTCPANGAVVRFAANP